ncbi:MAG: hypothetical protein ACKVWR_05630 [Acidimicrobiales bacterium]
MSTDTAAERDQLLASFVTRLRELEDELGVTPAFIEAAKVEAAKLAARRDLFGFEAFPPPDDGRRMKLHELAMGDDDRFAVYLTVSTGGVRAKPHDHQTWQLQVAVEGSERHRLYRRTDDRSDPWQAKLEQVGQVELAPGEAHGLLPEDIHAIEIPEGQPTAHVLVCGTGMHRLEGRLMYNPKNGLAQPMAPLNRREQRPSD